MVVEIPAVDAHGRPYASWLHEVPEHIAQLVFETTPVFTGTIIDLIDPSELTPSQTAQAATGLHGACSIGRTPANDPGDGDCGRCFPEEVRCASAESSGHRTGGQSVLDASSPLLVGSQTSRALPHQPQHGANATAAHEQVLHALPLIPASSSVPLSPQPRVSTIVGAGGALAEAAAAEVAMSSLSTRPRSAGPGRISRGGAVAQAIAPAAHRTGGERPLLHATKRVISAGLARCKASRLPPRSQVVEMVPKHKPWDILKEQKAFMVPAAQVRPASACFSWEGVVKNGQPAAMRPELAPKVCREEPLDSERAEKKGRPVTAGSMGRHPRLYTPRGSTPAGRQSLGAAVPGPGARAPHRGPIQAGTPPPLEIEAVPMKIYRRTGSVAYPLPEDSDEEGDALDEEVASVNASSPFVDAARVVPPVMPPSAGIARPSRLLSPRGGRRQPLPKRNLPSPAGVGGDDCISPPPKTPPAVSPPAASAPASGEPDDSLINVEKEDPYAAATMVMQGMRQSSGDSSSSHASHGIVRPSPAHRNPPAKLTLPTPQRSMFPTPQVSNQNSFNRAPESPRFDLEINSECAFPAAARANEEETTQNMSTSTPRSQASNASSIVGHNYRIAIGGEMPAISVQQLEVEGPRISLAERRRASSPQLRNIQIVTDWEAPEPLGEPEASRSFTDRTSSRDTLRTL